MGVGFSPLSRVVVISLDACNLQVSYTRVFIWCGLFLLTKTQTAFARNWVHMALLISVYWYRNVRCVYIFLLNCKSFCIFWSLLEVPKVLLHVNLFRNSWYLSQSWKEKTLAWSEQILLFQNIWNVISSGLYFIIIILIQCYFEWYN